jgi:hypothetical protein
MCSHQRPFFLTVLYPYNDIRGILRCAGCGCLYVPDCVLGLLTIANQKYVFDQLTSVNVQNTTLVSLKKRSRG